MQFTLYPIYSIADEYHDDPFDRTRLPFEIVEGLYVEDVSRHFREGTFDHHNAMLGREVLRKLETVRYGLVHRYHLELAAQANAPQRTYPELPTDTSQSLVQNVAACLRLIRPMRQEALSMWGNVRDEDGSFDVTGLNVPPLHLIEVPESQKLYSLRDQDADDLRRYAPPFLAAMAGEYWKFRMAVQFHQLGHFQVLDWKARYLLWCSAIESIYTSHNRNHKGSMVAKSRIKWFLGNDTTIYPPGELSRYDQNPNLMVRDIVDDLYEMRNFLAHGDRVPAPYFEDALRQGLNGRVTKREVLLEAASFIIRHTLLRILRDRLLEHFADAAPAEAYFEAHGLTGPQLRRAEQERRYRG